MKPFIKWAGGKRQIIDKLLEKVPEFNTYIEPFLGGGALLFTLKPKKAIIGDINEELINAYVVIKEKIDELIESLKKHKNEKEYYYKVRNLNPKELNNVERASRFIYLNKTCYNGLYRENSKGEFNVPFGKYKNPKILDEKNLREISEYLNSSDILILCGDFRKTCEYAKEGDFIYFDPPYYPPNGTKSFTKYSKYDFGEKEHIILYKEFVRLNNLGCKILMTNSNTEFVKNLYRDYNIEIIHTNRAINSKGEYRKSSASELIITNF